jgi:2-keto-3-deoxy-L-rhamnonate aldolase RhmA
MRIPTNGACRPTPTRSRTASDFVLTCWTADPALAARADAAGVDRVGPDLERAGKAARQLGRNTWISAHREADVDAVAGVLRRARLFARCDPAVDGQLERLLDGGVAFVMLPMFRDAETVAAACERAGERARIVPLVETREAVDAVEEVLAVPGVDELHVGLNDLSIAFGLPSRMSALVHPAVEHVAQAARAAGARLGLGGIGRAAQDDLPVPASLVYAQHARLGSRAALLSRSFFEDCGDLGAEVRAARAALATWRVAGDDEHERATARFRELAATGGW